MTDSSASTPPQDWGREVAAVAGMAVLFIVSISLALVVSPTYVEQDVRAFEDPNDVTNPIIYLVIVIAFTFVLLWIARKGILWLIRGIVLLAVALTAYYVTWPFLRLVIGDDAAAIVGLGAGIALSVLLYKFPEWYVIDAAGVLVSAGSAAIFGVSFGLVPALLLLVAFAVYDFIAVYRTKHMLDLADRVLELRLPIIFVVPKSRGYSFLKESRRIRDPAGPEDDDRDAMFMGLGDVVIPAVLIVSALQFLDAGAASAVLGFTAPAVVAGTTFLGSLAGYVALMWFVLRGNPQAGLPLLNGGAIVGFFAGLLPLYGLAPLLP